MGILKGVQLRKSAFGCVQAPVPDMFASNILVFLPNTVGDSEWKSIRFAMHSVLFGAANQRVKGLGNMLSTKYPNLKLADLNDTSVLQKIIAKAVIRTLFDIWLDDSDADVIAQWNTAAKMAI